MACGELGADPSESGFELFAAESLRELPIEGGGGIASRAALPGFADAGARSLGGAIERTRACALSARSGLADGAGSEARGGSALAGAGRALGRGAEDDAPGRGTLRGTAKGTLWASAPFRATLAGLVPDAVRD